MAVSPLQGGGIPSLPLPTQKTWAPERRANPHRREPTSCAPAASPELSRFPQPARAYPWRSRLPPSELPSTENSPHRSSFEGTFFCIASGRLPGDHRAILPPASRRRRPPPIQAGQVGRPAPLVRACPGPKDPLFSLPVQGPVQLGVLEKPQTKSNPNIHFSPIKTKPKRVVSRLAYPPHPHPQAWQRGFATVSSSLREWAGKPGCTPPTKGLGS